jgi:hypothetical protein
MAGTPATEAARQRATLSGDVVVREAVEAATHKLRRDWTVTFGCRVPGLAYTATTLDSLEAISVDDGSTARLPRHITHRHPTPRSKVLVHWDPRYLLLSKATLRGHTLGQRWRSPTTSRCTGPTPPMPTLTPLPPCWHLEGSLHGYNTVRRIHSSR